MTRLAIFLLCFVCAQGLPTESKAASTPTCSDAKELASGLVSSGTVVNIKAGLKDRIYRVHAGIFKEFDQEGKSLLGLTLLHYHRCFARKSERRAESIRMVDAKTWKPIAQFSVYWGLDTYK